MHITQQEFNELVYWTVQAYLTKNDSNTTPKQPKATNNMLNDYLQTISKGSLSAYISTTSEAAPWVSSPSIWLDIKNLLDDKAEETSIQLTQNYEQEITQYFNQVFETKYTYDPGNRQSLPTYFLKVHGVTIGTSLASLLLIGALAPSIIPVGLGVLAGAGIAVLPQMMVDSNSDGLGEAVQLLMLAAAVGLATVAGLIINPGMILPVLIGAGAAASSAVLTNRAAYCGTKFFNLPTSTLDEDLSETKNNHFLSREQDSLTA